ncbi:hypothetical protein [Sphingomonas sp. CROZ-RG-20F-R02-07]|nr:hypothetical protein [Sphingomonas sp. CROZ-RG-20F-R02-07]
MIEQDLAAIGDHDLIALYQQSGREAGDPIADAIGAEIERRGLDI